MSLEDLEKYETEMELQPHKEYRDVVGLFSHVVETERRFYLANSVDLKVRATGERSSSTWPWPTPGSGTSTGRRGLVKNVRVATFKDVNIEELPKPDIKLPDSGDCPTCRSGDPLIR